MKIILICLTSIFVIMWLVSFKTKVNPEVSNNYFYNWRKSKIIYDNGQKYPVRVNFEVTADIKTFEVIKDKWAKDNDGIFYAGKSHPEIDKKSFYLDKQNIPKDHQFVYTTTWEDNSKMLLIWEGADPKTFELLPLKDGYKPDLWGRDDKNYFYMLKPFDCDYHSFEIFDVNYSKDSNNVYYDRQIIFDADPTTFHYDLKTKLYKDKDHYYKHGKAQ